MFLACWGCYIKMFRSLFLTIGFINLQILTKILLITVPNARYFQPVFLYLTQCMGGWVVFFYWYKLLTLYWLGLLGDKTQHWQIALTLRNMSCILSWVRITQPRAVPFLSHLVFTLGYKLRDSTLIRWNLEPTNMH